MATLALRRSAAVVASLPTDWTVPDAFDDATAAQARTYVRNYLAGQVTWPVDVSASTNAYATVLSAQSAPAVVQAADSVPATWTPVPLSQVS